MNYKQLLNFAKETYKKETTVDTGSYKAIVQGEIRWNKTMTHIVCDSCPLYFAEENRWADICTMIEILAVKRKNRDENFTFDPEKITIQTSHGDIILQKFGKEYIALQNIPEILNKNCKTFIELKKNPENFIGKKLGTIQKLTVHL